MSPPFYAGERSRSSETAEFKKWLVPGVAQPPVYVLVTLLTIFVILVGPVAYRRTTKAGRGHLMFVIAPVLAVVTTVSMFAYGLAADGVSTIARIRQITWVDGATGAAGERVRATYFAPISPGDGLNVSGGLGSHFCATTRFHYLG